MWPKDTKGNKTKGVLNDTLAGGGPLFARKAAPGCPKMLSVPAPIVGEAFMPPAGKCRISGNVVLMGESGFTKAKPRERRSTPLQLRFRPPIVGEAFMPPATSEGRGMELSGCSPGGRQTPCDVIVLLLA